MQLQLEQVKQFMTACGQTINETPTMPGIKDQVLRRELILEEAKETYLAGTPIEALDGIVDQLYVLLGTIHTYGFSYEQITGAFARVHANNMTKVQPDGTVLRNVEGKIIKPEGFEPVDLSQVLEPNPTTVEGWLKRIPCPVIRKMALERMDEEDADSEHNLCYAAITCGWLWADAEREFWNAFRNNTNQTYNDLKHLLND